MSGNTLIVIGVIFFIMVKSGMNLFSNTVSYVKDSVADTLVGGFLGMRTTEASKAADWIRTRLWLRKDYRNWLLTHIKITDYNLDLMGEPQAEHIAHEIIQAKTTIFGKETIDNLIQWGFSIVPGPGEQLQDDPQAVVDAISQIQNQIQALQVVDYYYLKTKKNLSVGLQWLPNEQMIAVYTHLSSIGTGASKKNTIPGHMPMELTSLPKPPNT